MAKKAPARRATRKDTPMTNDKKLNAKELAKVQGGAAKKGASSGLAKASAGRKATPAKGVNLGSKRR
jgi:bacteriocin-like protein